MEEDTNDDFPWHLGVFDAHCHPTDTMSEVPNIPNMKAAMLTIMATRAQDQSLVADVAADKGFKNHDIPSDSSCTVIPAFGWHPWFSHQIFIDDAHSPADFNPSLDAESKIAHYQAVLTPKSDDKEFLTRLPDPIPLSALIQETEGRLRHFPHALVGEIGLDRAFKLPKSWQPAEEIHRDASLTPGGREGRTLSPYQVSLDHQRKVLLAQLKLAGRMKRPVSIHGVQAHGILFNTIEETWKGHERKISNRPQKKQSSSALYVHADDQDEYASSPKEDTFYPPRICLHSYSGSWEPIKQYVNPKVPAAVYFSFSVAVNFSTSDLSKIERVIQTVPDDRILTESDMHIAGAEMDDNLKKITKHICRIKGWDLNSGVQQLRQNFKNFILGESG